MTAFRGLLKKEYRLYQTSGIVSIVILVLYFLGVFVAAKYYSPDILAFFSFIPSAMGIWVVLLILVSSLGEERKKMHVWLYNPQPAWKLLGSKILIAAGMNVVWMVLSAAGGYAYYLSFLVDNASFLSWKWWHYAFLGAGVFVPSVYLALWFMFGWVVYHALNRFFRKWSLLVTIGLLAGIIFLIGAVETSGWFTTLTQWTAVSLNFPMGIEGTMDGTSGSVQVRVSAETISVLHVIYHVGIACLLFLLSCRLIDREVEV